MTRLYAPSVEWLQTLIHYMTAFLSMNDLRRKWCLSLPHRKRICVQSRPSKHDVLSGVVALCGSQSGTILKPCFLLAMLPWQNLSFFFFFPSEIGVRLCSGQVGISVCTFTFASDWSLHTLPLAPQTLSHGLHSWRQQLEEQSPK